MDFIFYFITALISMLPFVEGRSTLPFAILLFGINPLIVFFICVFTNIVPAIILMYYSDNIITFLKKRRNFRRLSIRLRILIRKNSRKISGYRSKPGIENKGYVKYMGLFFLVIIPAPLTGVWGGGFAASFLKLDIIKSILIITLANIIALFILYLGADVVVSNI